MDRTFEYTGLNRAGWDAIAGDRPGRPAGFFGAGGVELDEFEVSLLPDVTGKRLLQVACSNGDSALSWANRGALVTGVDISAVAIETAKNKARDAGVDVHFQQADIYDLPAGLCDFDVVYQSWGVVCWLPNLDRWAAIVADRMRVGGELLLCEHHPVWEVLGVRGENRLAATVDYFGRSRPTMHGYDTAKRPTGFVEGTTFAGFVWPVSEVVMSLQRAGFSIGEFFEAPVGKLYEGLGEAALRLPAIYVIKATKN